MNRQRIFASLPRILAVLLCATLLLSASPVAAITNRDATKNKIEEALFPFYDETVPNCGGTGSGTNSTPVNAPGKVYLLGDSIGAGLKNELPDVLPASAGWQFFGEPQVGRTLAQGLQIANSAPEDLKTAPTILIVLGTNNLNDGNNQANVDALVAKLKEINASAKLYWLTINVTRSDLTSGATQFNQLLARKTEVNKITNSADVASDGVHPADYPQLAGMVAASLRDNNSNSQQADQPPTSALGCVCSVGGSGSGTLSANVPEFWRNLIMTAAASPEHADVDPRMVAAVLWVENRGWPDPNRNWGVSSAGAKGPWQFIDSTWASMGQDMNGDGVANPNDPEDAVHAAFRHHKGSAGKPIAVTGYTGQNVASDYQTTVFEREDTNLLYYAAKYNGSGATSGIKLVDFPRRENTDYVVMAFWLLASDFQVGYVRGGSGAWGEVDAKTHGNGLLGAANGIVNRIANAGCPSAGQLVGNVAWPVQRSIYDSNKEWFSAKHGDNLPALDIPVPEGTDVYAMLSGRVVNAPAGGACGEGVKIESTGGVLIEYCHGKAGSIAVQQGDQVQAGQLIMKSGNTGESSGPHLHIGIKVGDTMRCPQTLFEGMGEGTAPAMDSLPTEGCTL